jgi:hypothetical protein
MAFSPCPTGVRAPNRLFANWNRFLVSKTFLMEGLVMSVSILDISGSDHWPIQLYLDISRTPGRKPFHFEHFWINHPDFQALNLKWWREATISHGSKMFRFQQRLKNFKQSLKLWNRQHLGNIFKAQRNLKDQMESIQIQIRNRNLMENLKAQEYLLKQKLEEQCSQ